MNTSTIIIIVAALLVAYAIYYTVQKFRGKAKASCCGTAEAVSAVKVADTDKSHYHYHYKLNVEEMMCNNCARNVENTLNGMGDVWAHVNLGRKEADVLSKSQHIEEDFRSALSGTDYRLAGYSDITQ